MQSVGDIIGRFSTGWTLFTLDAIMQWRMLRTLMLGNELLQVFVQ